MDFKKANLFLILGVVIVLSVLSLFIFVKKDTINKTDYEPIPVEQKKYTNKKDNAKCLQCHASHKYQMAKPDDSTAFIYRKMPNEFIIDTAKYYQSNHWNFKCFDCHSDEYSKAPHDAKLRFNEMATCLDCHGGDEAYAKYNFETIESEFQKSIHFQHQGIKYNCWSCHDAHTYKINARNKHQKITKTIEYDNTICLSCHDNNDNLDFFDKTLSSISKTHHWLPNIENHFKNVRCIECHASTNDSILASHNIQSKQKAIKGCAKCHSTNSILMESLYKDSVKSKKYGFVNSIILNESYVVGSNRNYILNLLSIITFIVTIFGISIHILFRIILNRKKHGSK